LESEQRRKRLKDAITSQNNPITGGELAKLLGVSRQVIVQDIALMRASGLRIVATPSGYCLLDAISRPMRVFFCHHKSVEDAEREMLLIVNLGGCVRDVTIVHPVYGEITGALMIKTPEAVYELMSRLRQSDSMMLSSITDGVHMHTVEADNVSTLHRIEQELRKEGLLQPFQR